jgi:hypothetical protein
VPSPPAIVLDPPPRAGVPPVVPLTAQVFAAPRDPNYRPPGNDTAPYAIQPRPFGSGIAEWLSSGRGWTWGAARYGPVRDQGLDRLMAETLGSSSPQVSNEHPTDCSVVSNESWLYPSTPLPSGTSRSGNSMAELSDRRQDPGIPNERAPTNRVSPGDPRDATRRDSQSSSDRTRSRSGDEWRSSNRQY